MEGVVRGSVLIIDLMGLPHGECKVKKKAPGGLTWAAVPPSLPPLSSVDTVLLRAGSTQWVQGPGVSQEGHPAMSYRLA